MAKMHKILMLIENHPVPPDDRVWAEAITLQEAGFQVSIIGPKGSIRDKESYICVDGIHIYRYRLPTSAEKASSYILEYGVALFMTFLLSFKVLVRHGFDVIHAANPPDILCFIGLFYRLLGKKFLFDQHDLSPEMFQVKFKNRMQPLYRMLLFLEWCSYKAAHVVITTNVSQKQFAMKRGSCPADKVFVVRNGPDLERIKLVASELELKGDRQYLLGYVGAMEVQDGVAYALYAIHALIHKRGHRNISAVFMGDGDHAPMLHALAHELQLDEYVTFTGWSRVQDVVRYLTVIDVGLSPDPRNELNDYCTMVKVMEYMAMGKPVVSFDLAETHFSAQDAALYATPNNVEEFADRIEQLLNDEVLRLKLGAIGRKRVIEELSWDHTKLNLLRAYEVLFPALQLSPTTAQVIQS